MDIDLTAYPPPYYNIEVFHDVMYNLDFSGPGVSPSGWIAKFRPLAQLNCNGAAAAPIAFGGIVFNSRTAIALPLPDPTIAPHMHGGTMSM